MEQEGEAGGLDHRDGNSQVSGPLRYLALTHCALLLPLFDLGYDHTEDLHDDRRGDVGHYPQREDRELGERAAREELHVGQDSALVGTVSQRLDCFDVDTGCGDERPQAIERDHRQGEENLHP